MKNVESEQMEAQAILRSILRTNAASVYEAETLQDKKESLKRTTVETIAQGSVSSNSGSKFSGYLNKYALAQVQAF